MCATRGHDQNPMEQKKKMLNELLGADWTQFLLLLHYQDDPNDWTSYFVGWRDGRGGLIIENGEKARFVVTTLLELEVPIKSIGIPLRVRVAKFLRSIMKTLGFRS